MEHCQTMAEESPKTFFSYAREDSEFALRLVKDLRAAGADVWLDQLDIGPGQRWDSAVENALRACPRHVTILSPGAVNSQNVMDEVSYALEERKQVIPLLYRDCTVPFRLRRLQYIDFRTDYARGLRDLSSVLVIKDAPAVLASPMAPIEGPHTPLQAGIQAGSVAQSTLMPKQQRRKIPTGEAERREEGRRELAKAYNKLGLAYAGKKDYDRAIQHYNQALLFHPKDGVALNNRGIAYEHKGQYNQAMQDYEQTLKLDPNNAKARASRDTLAAKLVK